MRFFPLFFAGLLTFGLVDDATAQTTPAWQQRVRYEMDVTLDTARHHLDGFQRLTYHNNSPDTLRQVFYHLYFNAFHPQSMMAERNRHLPDPDGRIVPRIWNLGPDEIGYHRVERLTQDGTPVAFETTDTVMQVDLATPILPGGTAVFEMEFQSQIPLQTRRSGRDNAEGIDYSMSQWYPKMAAYDARGWHADPYVGREFYAPFGTFDVRLTLPARYVVGATGVLQNPDDIGHGYGQPAPESSHPVAADTLTWHFRAENVHDFAWAADPDYIHEQIEDDSLGVTYHLLYQPEVAARWEPMRQIVPALIRYLSARVGDYPWPQFTVAQAGDGGMEYPMINFITGRRSPGSLLGVTAHEAAHEWFYGVLGNNEADYSWMDEGFTAYMTTEAIAHVVGNPNPSHMGSFLGVLALQEAGIAERLNTPADWFEANAAFGVASYSGGAVLVEMLGYVMSDSLRDAWLRHYYETFKFRHPTPFDLEKLAEDVSGLQLDWFFEQFANTTRPLDYELDDLDSRRTADGWTTTVELEREAPAVVPIDLRLTFEDGSTQWVNIPLGIMQGHKPVPDDWIVAEPWLWTFPEYTFTHTFPQRVVEAEIDPLGRTPDRDRLNNASRFPVAARFLHPPQASWMEYGVGYRPLVTYAEDYGVGLGAQLRGEALFGDRQFQATLTVWPEVMADADDNIGGFDDAIDYGVRYRRRVAALGPGTSAEIALEKHLGNFENRVTASKSWGGGLFGGPYEVSASLIHQHRGSFRAFTGVPGFGSFWSRAHVFTARLEYAYARGDDRLAVALEAGGPFGDGDAFEGERATVFTLAATKAAPLGPFTGWAHFQFGYGADDLVSQKRFVLGAATPEAQWRDAAFRTLAAVPESPREDFHLAPFAEAGPVAYLLPGQEGFFALAGNRLLAGTLALSAEPFSKGWLSPLSLEAFSGIGTVWNEFVGFDADRFVADAGLGASFDVGALPGLNRWTGQSDVLSGLHLAARFPFWMSDPELLSRDEDAVAFRWLLGIRVER